MSVNQVSVMAILKLRSVYKCLYPVDDAARVPETSVSWHSWSELLTDTRSRCRRRHVNVDEVIIVSSDV